MKIGDKLIVGVQIDEDDETLDAQIKNIDFQNQFDNGTLTIYSDMQDATESAETDEKIVILELIDFGTVLKNPKFKSEKLDLKKK